MAEAVDHEARSEAALAHQRISDGEKACAERWSATLVAIKELRQALNEFRKAADSRSGKLSTLVIVTLMSVVGMLGVMLFDMLK